MEIGVGSAISKTFGFIFVARYSPKGGVGAPEIFRKNVFVTGSLQVRMVWYITVHTATRWTIRHDLTLLSFNTHHFGTSARCLHDGY